MWRIAQTRRYWRTTWERVPGRPYDRDQHGVGLLAEGIADQELAGAAGPGDVAAVEPLLGDGGEEVLVEIRQALAIGREALVPETLEQVAAVDPEGALVVLGIVAGSEPFEPVDVELDQRIAVDARSCPGRPRATRRRRRRPRKGSTG